jgi:hypothetical protein
LERAYKKAVTTLSSLVVARQAASIAQVDEALARQVVEGGDLGTCLLELGNVTEEVLLPVLAEACGIQPAGVGELPVASPSVLRLVPRAVAARYALYPLEEREGELHVAVAEPLPQPVEDDLGFALGAHLRQFAAPMVRIRQAIGRDYGVPLEPRFLALLAKLENQFDTRATTPAPARRDDTPPFPSAAITDDRPARGSKSGTLIVGSGVPPPSSRATPRIPGNPNPTPPPPVRSTAAKRNTWPGVFTANEAKPPETAIPGQSAGPTPVVPGPISPTPVSSPPVPPPEPSSAPPPRKTPAPPPADFVIEATMATAAELEKKRRRRAERPSGKILLGWARRALGNTIPSDRGPERQRGPLTPAAVELQLEEAHTGEEALGIFFAFAKQYFDYSAIFMVHGDLAAGHDAWGPGATRDKVRGVGFSLDLPSALSHARDRRAPVLAELKRAGLDGDLRNDLGRSAPHEVLVFPILVLGRCVALLYGDDGDEPVDYAQIGEVIAMAPLVAAALERILLRRKRAALRDASGIKSKLAPNDERSQMSNVPPPETRVDRARPVTAPPDDLSQVVAKRAGWDEEELVDEGWTMPTDPEPPPRSASARQPPARQPSASQPALRQPPARQTPARLTPARLPPAREPPARQPPARQPPLARPTPPRQSEPRAPLKRPDPPQFNRSRTPPPPQVAAVRPLSKKPIAREEVDEPAPELTVSETPADDASLRSLLDDIEDDLSPSPPPADSLASTSISASAHPPPASRVPFRDLPPVLIRSELVDQVIGGGERGDKALGEILALGEAAIPSVFARFPGPLTVDRDQALGDLPRPADCGPVLRIVAAMRRLALPFLAVRSADIDVEIRFWATYLLGELNYSEASAALLPRLFDENAAVRRIAIRSARTLAGAGDEAMPLRKSLERMVAYPDEPEARRLTAVWTIGELKLYRSIPTLISALSDPLDSMVEAASRALSAMTRQELGRDPRKWSEWWDTKGRKQVP